MAAVADPLGDLQIGLSGVTEEFGKLRSYISVLLDMINAKNANSFRMWVLR